MAHYAAFMDDSSDGGENDVHGRRTVWCVAIIVPRNRVAALDEALDRGLSEIFPDVPRPIPEVHFVEFVGDGGAIRNSAEQCRDLMTTWRRILVDADARIVARGIHTREVAEWIGRVGGGRTPYDVAFGHAVQHVSRIAPGRVDVVHDEHGNHDELRATFERARSRGVYSRRSQPCENLRTFEYGASSDSRILQAADMYAWCFQRVWAKAPSHQKGAHAARMLDDRSELARMLLSDSRPLIAHRRVWRPRIHARGSRG